MVHCIRIKFVSRLIFTLVMFSVVFVSSGFAQVGKGSPSFTAEHLMKIAALNSSINVENKPISIFVLEDPPLAAELQKKVGTPIGKASITKVEQGSTPPGDKYDILYIGNPDKYLSNMGFLDKVTEYTRGNSVLSVTHEAILVYKGISLGVFEENGAISYMINMKGSKAEGQKWKKSALKIAETL